MTGRNRRGDPVGMRTPPVMLRPARVDGVEVLSELALRSKAHWGYDDDFIEACRHELTVQPHQVEGHRLTVAVDSITHRVLGFYGLTGTTRDDAELSALFVEPDVMGTGIGRLLLDHALHVAVDIGSERVRIEADPFAAAFYEHAGATRVGDVASHSIADRRLPLYVIDISARTTPGASEGAR